MVLRSWSSSLMAKFEVLGARMLRLPESKKSEDSWDLKTFGLGPKHRSREVFASAIFFSIPVLRACC